MYEFVLKKKYGFHNVSWPPESLLTQMAFQAIKPTVLIGTSGKGQTFTKDVVEAISSFNEVNSTN
jgi:malic enzyme